MSNPTEAFLDHQTPEDLSKLTPGELMSRYITARISIEETESRIRLLWEEVMARIFRDEAKNE